MRLMGNEGAGVAPNHAEVYWDAATDPKAMAALQSNLANDPSMPKGVSSNSFYKILGAPYVAIQSFIAGSTKNNTSYIPGVSPYVLSNTGLAEVAGSPPEIKTAPCANLSVGCSSGVGTQQNIPLTPAQQQMIGSYFGKASTDYQRAAALATAAGSAPIALSFEIAAGLAGLLEQAFTPSAGKVVLDSALVDSLAKALSDRTGLPIFLVNEVAEREIKPRLQSGRNAIDQFVVENK